MLKSAGFSFSMKYLKPAFLYTDQLNLLIGRKLNCGDHTRAIEWLQRIGYYRLSAYFIPFRNSITDEFRAGVTLDHVLDLYKFDGGLGLLTMQAMDRIEVAVRAVVTYEMAHELGVFGYADPANFDPTFDHAWFIKLISKEESGHRKRSSPTIAPSTQARRICRLGWQRS